MNRSRAALAAALLLGCAVATAPPAAADEPLPYAPGKVHLVRPGDVLAVTVGEGKLENGDVVTSKAFLADGVLRMHAPRLTATVAIKCDATPGIHPVEIQPPAWARTSEHGTPFTTVRVEKADDAAVRECRTKLKNLAPDSKEEQWPKGTKWPRTEWDVRSFPAGSRVVATSIGHDFDGSVSLVSPAFADKPVLSGGKAEQSATATIRCDAKPGLYPVYQYDKDASSKARPEVWARYRVVPADEATGRACRTEKQALAADDSRTPAVAWAVGGAALVGVAGALFLIRRARSRGGSGEPPSPTSPGSTATSTP